jgi:hypothetical protein
MGLASILLNFWYMALLPLYESEGPFVEKLERDSFV